MTNNYEKEIMQLEFNLAEYLANKKSGYIATGITYLVEAATLTMMLYPEIYGVKDPIFRFIGGYVGIFGAIGCICATGQTINSINNIDRTKKEIEVYQKYANPVLEGEYIAAQDSNVEFNTSGLEGKILPLNKKVNG